MKLRFLLTILFVLLLSSPLFAFTGREIMEKNDALPEAETAISELQMLKAYQRSLRMVKTSCSYLLQNRQR